MSVSAVHDARASSPQGFSMVVNGTEAAKRAHLEKGIQKLAAALGQLEGRVSRYARDVGDQKAHIRENKGDMDHIEKIAARESAETKTPRY
ncbi:hypothetical protein [Myxococcus sp. SDU36]|uniref:hypothetical protein n=1 Tax=Myxococcus sp. SDU36 TaxID=2831967 RepID=UPI002542A4D1|nr:hypothetical protein [Myxococcus sp. SDU36]WIG98785.1 hypothetical protein KGD87_16105 [Myxococcus sp. SDU36]